MNGCDQEELERHARGALDEQRGEAVEAHVAGCTACAGELSWLRREQSLFAARRAAGGALPSELWRAVELRIAEPVSLAPRVDSKLVGPRQRRRRWAIVGGVGMAAALASAVIGQALSPTGLHRSSRTRSAASASSDDDALAQAERQYLAALAELEKEYAARRGRLAAPARARFDGTIATARLRLAEASREAADVTARERVLDGYSNYLHSLQEVIYQSIPRDEGDEDEEDEKVNP